MKRALAILASAALLAWLVGDGRWRELGAIFGRLDLLALAPGVAGLLASYVLRAARVHDEFRTQADRRFTACLRIVLIHNAMVNLVPFRAGEVAFPMLLRQAFGTPLDRALASLVWFRLQDALVVALLAAAVWPDLPLALRLVIGIVLLGFAWCLPRWVPTARRRGPGVERERVGTKFVKLRSAFASSVHHSRRGWMWTTSNWSVKLAAQAWMLAALLPASASIGAAGAFGAELAAILPVQGLGGFGTYEAGAAAAMLPHGIGLDHGLRAALALHLVVLGCSTGAGALALLLPSQPAGTADDRSSASGKPRTP